MRKLILVFMTFVLSSFSLQLFAQETFNSVKVNQKCKHKKKYTYTNLIIKRLNNDSLIYSYLPIYKNNIYNNLTERQNDYVLYCKPTILDGNVMVRVPDDSPRDNVVFTSSIKSISFPLKYYFGKDNIYVERIFNPKTKQGIKITVYLPANSGIPVKDRKAVTYKIEQISDFYE